MDDTVQRGPSLVFLAISWVVFTALCVVAIAMGGWIHLLGLGALWAAITGMLIRRLWPRSKLGRLFPEKHAGGRRYDEPVSRPLRTILIVLVIGALVAAATLLGWR